MNDQGMNDSELPSNPAQSRVVHVVVPDAPGGFEMINSYWCRTCGRTSRERPTVPHWRGVTMRPDELCSEEPVEVTIFVGHRLVSEGRLDDFSLPERDQPE